MSTLDNFELQLSDRLLETGPDALQSNVDDTIQNSDVFLTNSNVDEARSDDQSRGNINSIETMDTIMEIYGGNTSSEGTSSGSGSGSQKGVSSRHKKWASYRQGKKGKNSLYSQKGCCISETSPFVINASCDNLEEVNFIAMRIEL